MSIMSALKGIEIPELTQEQVRKENARQVAENSRMILERIMDNYSENWSEEIIDKVAAACAELNEFVQNGADAELEDNWKDILKQAESANKAGGENTGKVRKAVKNATKGIVLFFK